MCGVSVRICLVLFGHAYAEELAVPRNTQASIKLVDETVSALTGSLHDRAIKASPLHHTDLDNTTFGKVARSSFRPAIAFSAPQQGFHREAASPGLTQMPMVQSNSHRRQRMHVAATAANSITERIMTNLPTEEQSSGAGGQSTYEGLLRMDSAWQSLKKGQLPKARHIVSEESDAPLESPEFDVIVCGGTIGILVAAALQVRGLRVAVVEAGKLRGRSQDWNASRKEVEELVKLGVLTQLDLESVIGIEFNPVRVGFPRGKDVWLQDVLNVGIRPDKLIAAARRTFESKGGVVFENSPLKSVAVRPGAAVLRLGGQESNDTAVKTRLLLDCMGQRSPIVSQIRDGQPPDGVAVVVGSMARGFDEKSNIFGDVIFANSLTQPAGDTACPTQYFWEAFPASSGPRDRTSYLFTYMDLDPARPSVLNLMEDYWKLMPNYQGVKLEDLEFRRVVYGLFTSYKDSPLPSGFDRILQIGDASGIQSPLSFGGFGAITRHLGRLTSAIGGALEADALTKAELSLVNPYQPNLRTTWLFQNAMKPPVGPAILDGSADSRMVWADDFISKLLVVTFAVMEEEGQAVMQPFLQDVLRVDGLVRTIGGFALRRPLITAQILANLGPVPILDSLVHFSAMCLYTALHNTATPLLKRYDDQLPPRLAYRLARCIEEWEYGSGLDYVYEPSTQVSREALERAKAAAKAIRARAEEPELQVVTN